MSSDTKIQSSAIPATVPAASQVQAATPAPSPDRTPAASSAAKTPRITPGTFEVKAKVGDDLQKLSKQIDDVVKELSQYLESNSRNLAVHVDRALPLPVVVVKDRFSGEVIRQIPNEVVVKMAHSIDAFKGWLHDQAA